MGFFGFLTILFIALKLLGVISWAWWIVLAPLWSSIILGFIVLFIIIWRKGL